MDLTEHSRKNNEVPNEDDSSESREHHGHRLNRIYQGSLRESGSTGQTPLDTEGTSAATTIIKSFPKLSIILIIHCTLNIIHNVIT